MDTPVNEIALSEDRLMSLIDVVADLRRQVQDMKNEAKAGGGH